MGKRKRYEVDIHGAGRETLSNSTSRQTFVSEPGWPSTNAVLSKGQSSNDTRMTIQIVIGTYEKVLHGITATIPEKGSHSIKKQSSITFADTFLFTAHSSAIRCLAIGPRSSANKAHKIMLASGSADQTVNLYQLSTLAPPPLRADVPAMPPLASTQAQPNPGNKELGSLQHHAGGVNALHFPTRSKLISAAEDSTIAITRTRDWTVLSAIKAPIPKAHGRPSGDTAPYGSTPSGINDFAIHPSLKLMVSVGKGERCMRLWNLVTGKKAGVLSFEKVALLGIGEGRWSSGEGRKVRWNGPGEEFVVSFERGCVVYGIDSKPKCRLLPRPSTKIHQIRYITGDLSSDTIDEVVAVSTEDGRIIFFSTEDYIIDPTDEPDAVSQQSKPRSQLGGHLEGLTDRIKDFEVLTEPDGARILIITGSSDGAIRVWELQSTDIFSRRDNAPSSTTSPLHVQDPKKEGKGPKQVGQLLGVYEAGSRITCLTAFLMSQSPNGEMRQ